MFLIFVKYYCVTHVTITSKYFSEEFADLCTPLFGKTKKRHVNKKLKSYTQNAPTGLHFSENTKNTLGLQDYCTELSTYSIPEV